MIVAGEIRERGHWNGPGEDTITLDEAQRHRRRMAMVSDGGIAFLLDLPEARLLVEGDAIVLSDGRLVEVRAKPEPLLAVAGRNADHLVELAWQIGNRHLPCQIQDGRILLRRDHVIADMLRGLGAEVSEVEAAFDPVGGAYAGGHGHGGHGGHGHGHG